MERYMLLQQVGGSSWGVYDLVRGQMVRTYDEKYAKEYAVELFNVLDRGWRHIDEKAAKNDTATPPTEGVRRVQKIVHSEEN